MKMMIGRQRCVPQEVAELAELVEAADKKIDTSLGPGPSRGEIEFARRILVLYGEHAKGFWFAPNHSCCEPARGYQLGVTGDAPMSCAQFPEDTMFNGMLAFPLDAGVASGKLATGQEIPDGYFNQEFIRDAMRKCADKLGTDPTSFLGVFESTYRRGYEKKKRYWIVVQACSEKVSQEFFECIVEVEGSRTWDEVFSKGKLASKYIAEQCKHRAILVAVLARAFKLGNIADGGGLDDTIKGILSAPETISTVFNTIEHRDGVYMYLSDVASSMSIPSSGILIKEPGRLGVQILHGPIEVRPDAKFIGFPVSTSPMQKTTSAPGCNPCNAFFWHSDHPSNPALSTAGATTREDPKWVDLESMLGYRSERGFTVLDPLQVMLHSP